MPTSQGGGKNLPDIHAFYPTLTHYSFFSCFKMSQDANAITKAGVRYRLSVIRVLDVRDINKAETCNWHCGMIGFATWSRKSRPSFAWKVNRRAIQRCASSSRKQMKITIKYSNATLFIFATLTIGTYDTMNPVDETMKLERKEGWHFL